MREDRDRLLRTLGDHPLGGLLAAPLADTLKQGTHNVERTLERAGLWRALTPQMFRYASLCAALDQAIAAQRMPTDESQAIEWTGGRPVLVEGAATNLKITSPADLRVAEALLVTTARTGTGRCDGVPR
jgi:2-C-methyl-D-erythritol 4-phosphate cytidylyltransferase